MRPINEIIVHCSATRADWMEGQPTSAKVAEIRRWHVKDRGWKDIGYHYLIDRDGTVVWGRPLAQVGAHVAGHNTGTIGVCLMGGHGSNENDQFSEHFTAAQDMALRSLLTALRQDYGVKKITGHNQYAAKACPGFRVSEWLASESATKPGTVPTQPTGGGFFAALAALFGKLFGGRK